jgi:nucleoside-diphosphate-sugar epimerase
MRVLITGGTGFIGAALARRLAANGSQVSVIAPTNNEWEERRARELAASGIELINGSILDAALTGRACAGRDLVVHLAAAQHETGVDDAYFWRINVEGTRTMLDASVAAGVGRFIHGSTIGVYGDGSGSGPLDESSATAPVNRYGRSKLQGERLAASYQGRLALTIIRISETYGPGDMRLLKLFRGLKSGWFAMIGSGANVHQPVYVDDLVDGILLAHQSSSAVSEIIILAGAQPLTTKQMVADVARAVGSHGPRLRLPMPLLLMAARACERVAPPLGLRAPLTERRLDFFRKNFAFSQQKAQRLLGFQPRVAFAEGTAKTAAWYTANGLL